MVVFIRHGLTKLDEGKVQKYSGWLPVPLDMHGMKNAEKTAKRMKSLNLDVKHLYSSPLVRAIQTATETGMEIGMEVEPNDGLLGWNVGKFENTPENSDAIFHYIDNPSKKVPGGESYYTFGKRALNFLKPLVKSRDLVATVSHSVVANLLYAVAKKNLELLKKDCPVKPSGIMLVHPDWSVEIC